MSALSQRISPHQLEAFSIAAALGGGLMRGAQLRELGVGSHAFGALVRSGLLVCLRRGIYVEGSMWRDATAEARYRMFVRATAMEIGPGWVVSHLSAAALHGLPLIGNWPSTTHTSGTRLTGGSSSRHLTTHRVHDLDHVVVIDGVTVTSLIRTLIDVASTQPFLVGVTMCDHVLHVEQRRMRTLSSRHRGPNLTLTPHDLAEELARVRPSKGLKMAERVIEFATPLAESPGESLSRVRLLELGFEIPELQTAFVDLNGEDRRVDYFWRGIRKIGEFDGQGKYLRGGVGPGQSPGDKVMEEKRREDALRPLVNSVSRWDWATAISPAAFLRFLTEHGVPRAH